MIDVRFGIEAKIAFEVSFPPNNITHSRVCARIKVGKIKKAAFCALLCWSDDDDDDDGQEKLERSET